MFCEGGGHSPPPSQNWNVSLWANPADKIGEIFVV